MGPAGPQGQPGEPGDTSEANQSLKTDNIGYFDPDIKGSGPIVTIGCHACYHNIFMFINHLCNIVCLKGKDLVHAYVLSSLHGTALEWFTSKLTPFEKDSLQECMLESAWIPMLLDHFKPHPADALQALKNIDYSIHNVHAGWSVHTYTQEVFWHARAAQVMSVFNQLTLAWSQLDIWLCWDIPEPTPETTMLDFLNQLEGKASIWQDMVNSHFESRQQTLQQHYPKHSDAHYKHAPTHTQYYQPQPFIQLQISLYTPLYGQPAPQWQTGFPFNSAWQGWQPTWQPGNNWQ